MHEPTRGPTAEEVAVHEIGHALMMIALGRRVVSVTIEPVADYLGRVTSRVFAQDFRTLAPMMHQGDVSARRFARGALVNLARVAGAGPVAEAMWRGAAVGWSPGGVIFWTLPAGEVPDTYGDDVLNLYAALHLASRSTTAVVGYEWRLWRELRAYFKRRREVLRDLAGMLLLARTLTGEAFLDAARHTCERRGVEIFEPRACGSWWTR